MLFKNKSLKKSTRHIEAILDSKNVAFTLFFNYNNSSISIRKDEMKNWVEDMKEVLEFLEDNE